jgi:hypothetical protein
MSVLASPLYGMAFDAKQDNDVKSIFTHVSPKGSFGHVESRRVGLE